MPEELFHLREGGTATLRSRVREMLVTAILSGHIPAGAPAPPLRKLARQLGIGRNTVLFVYNQLVEEGFLVARERSGYFVDDAVASGRAMNDTGVRGSEARRRESIDYRGRLRTAPSGLRNITKPRDWEGAHYPFVYGQLDQNLFPAAEWRECCRQALTKLAIHDWAPDQFDVDQSELIEQIRTRVLPRRGIWTEPAEILVTMGAQHALFLLADLLMTDKRLGFEEPGYPDARNMFSLRSRHIKPLPLDEHGLVVSQAMRGLDYLYTTPSHQSPTTVTMTIERRRELMACASEYDFVIVEDDYEQEVDFGGKPVPALKSLDTEDRVIYVGSLSKSLAPGLRLGYMVGPEELIYEARVLRRLMLRHPPANNGLAVALFLSQGHYDALTRRLRDVWKERWHTMGEALGRHSALLEASRGYGGSSFWVQGPPNLDAGILQREAAGRGILIEPGDVFFMSSPAPTNYFRLGFSSIPTERITPGIDRLAALVSELT